MTIQQLIYVIETDKQGSFSAAASSLYTAQPTISVAIRELEEEIGYKIFLRTNKGIKLTSRGVEFIHYAKKVIFEFENLNDVCLQETNKCKIKFKVSSQHYGFLSEAFIKFLDLYKYDSYNFVIKETKSLEAIEDVYQKKSNIAIIVVSDYNRTILNDIFEKKGIAFHKISQPQPHIFFRANHPLANSNSITIDQLADYPVIIFEQDGNDLLSEELIIQKKLNKIMYVNDRATLLGIACSSDAYNIGTGYLSQEMKDVGIISLPINLKQTTTQEIGWIHLEKYEPSLETYQFIEIVKELLITNEYTLSSI